MKFFLVKIKKKFSIKYLTLNKIYVIINMLKERSKNFNKVDKTK